MAAVLSTNTLTLLEHASLKHLPSTPVPTCLLALPSSTVVWSVESGQVFLGSADGSLRRLDVASGSLQDIALSARSSTAPIVSLLCKDRGSAVIYGQGQHVVVLSTVTGKPSNTFDTHKAPVTSLSLCNDASLLASTSAHAIHVHNLTLASHTVLRGIPTGSDSIMTCAFHPHSRTRLLVGLGTQLLVYDTTRPSGPVKTIEVDKEKRNLGPIVAISCSPFSKTLVAVAYGGGIVALVDLEKEKGLFRTVTMPAPVTCLSFSAEGAAVYAGTENGRFLLLDLRALDKPPKSVTVSDNGDRIVALSVQRKLKPGETVTKAVTSTATASKPLVQRDVNKAPPASRTNDAAKKPTDIAKEPLKPPRMRAASGSTAPTGTATTPRRTTVRSTSTASLANVQAGRVASGSRPTTRPGPKSPAVTRAPAAEARTRAFSPPRSPNKNDEDADSGDVSVQIENLLAVPRVREPVVPSTIDDAQPATATSRAPSALSRASTRSQLSDDTKMRSRLGADSASRASTSESISTARPRARAESSASIASHASKASARSATATGRTSASPVRAQARRVSGSTVSRSSRTPSPALPDVDDGGPVTPIPAYKVKGKERAAAAPPRGVLGLGTPEVDEWVKAGEGLDGARTGKRVGFARESDEEEEEGAADAASSRTSLSDSDDDDDDDDDDAGFAPPRTRAELAMQISPRRSFPGPGAANASRWAPVPSPLRNPAASSYNGGGGSGVPASPQARAAQDMLQALLRDALHEFRAETKAEIVGLHLDLIRMGGSWRREMHEAVGGLGEELRTLREENARLREENERLRRGY
ncbi:WD40-repeat-containing domain protein [Trametes gibbosa]|nr:WD40-repeat-containing domain protein [Trametes gibbosa]